MAGETVFTGAGQGRSPFEWRDQLREPGNGWLRRGGPALVAELTGALAALPEQDRPRTDPAYALLALSKQD